MHYLRTQLNSCVISTDKEISQNYDRDMRKMMPSLKLLSINILGSQISEIETQNHTDFIYKIQVANVACEYNVTSWRYCETMLNVKYSILACYVGLLGLL